MPLSTKKREPAIFTAALKVYDAEAFAEFPVGQRLEVEVRGFALDVLDHVGAFVCAVWHIVEGHVGDAEEQGVDLGLQRADGLFECADAGADLPHFIYQLLGALARLSNLAADLVAAGAQFVGFDDGGAAICVKLGDAVERGVFVAAAHCFAHFVGLVAYELDVNQWTPRRFLSK